jgi:hypothetical protein
LCLPCRFYATFQATKYFTRVVRNESDYANGLTAGVVAVTPMLVSATFRRNVPYAVLLIAMDMISEMG